MAKNTSTQIREFVKNALKSYYGNFQVKLSDNAKKDDVNPAIKLNNDGSVYIYGLGNYDGTSIRNASSLQEIIIELGKSHSDIIINAGNNIQVDTVDTTSTISALGYIYNSEKNSYSEGNNSSAYGNNSHAEGYHTTAKNDTEHAEGKYNQSHEGKTIHSVGIGSSSQSKNALEILNDGSIFITGLNTVRSYDGTSITNVSTLQEVINEKLDKSSAAAGLSYEVVQQLPTNPESNVIYLVPSTTSITENVYDEKLYINNTWETIGSTQADLTNYYTKPECNTTFSLVGHAHGNISNSGAITATAQQITSHSIVVTNTNGDVLKTNVAFNDSGQESQFLNIRGDWAVPTDTKNTVGAHNSDSRLYLVGAAGDGDAVRSYVNTSVYMQNGNITAVAFYQSSDERLKNIKSELSVENCYKLINDCSTIIYSLKTDEKDQNQIGMIAQQVKEIMPEVVQESNGYYSINYSRLSVVALNLIKDLSERIIELEKDHNKLEELIKRVEKLEK